MPSNALKLGSEKELLVRKIIDTYTHEFGNNLNLIGFFCIQD